MTLIFSIIGIVALGVLIKLFLDYDKDLDDVENQSLNEKFKTIVDVINENSLEGGGTIIPFDKWGFTLANNKIETKDFVNFKYFTGDLQITWVFEHMGRRLKHQETFNNVRNLSWQNQTLIGEKMIKGMFSQMELRPNKKGKIFKGLDGIERYSVKGTILKKDQLSDKKYLIITSIIMLPNIEVQIVKGKLAKTLIGSKSHLDIGDEGTFTIERSKLYDGIATDWSFRAAKDDISDEERQALKALLK